MVACKPIRTRDIYDVLADYKSGNLSPDDEGSRFGNYNPDAMECSEKHCFHIDWCRERTEVDRKQRLQEATMEESLIHPKKIPRLVEPPASELPGTPPKMPDLPRGVNRGVYMAMDRMPQEYEKFTRFVATLPGVGVKQLTRGLMIHYLGNSIFMVPLSRRGGTSRGVSVIFYSSSIEDVKKVAGSKVYIVPDKMPQFKGRPIYYLYPHTIDEGVRIIGAVYELVRNKAEAFGQTVDRIR